MRMGMGMGMGMGRTEPEMKSFHMVTYGCQMNVRDADSVEALLVRRGYSRARGETDADIVIVNTCSVRGKAEQKALGKLGLLVKARREQPGKIVGVMGCMVQRMGPRLFDKVPGLDFAVGTHRLARLPAVLDLVAAGEGPVLEAAEEREATEDLSDHVDGNAAAFVNILLGCDRRCAYCVVPSVRGREWSRPAERILDEVRSLAARGVRDVTLLGQSVMSYGRRNTVWPPDSVSARGFTEPLARLLEAVDAVDGIDRVRFTSGHPRGCTPELVRAMAELPAVCEHLHLPLQSGSDRILDRMRRGYTVDDYRRAVAALRRAVPALALTTDIIVGFPTETSAEFEQTRACMEEMEFDNAFIFKYSPRPNTPAADWPDDVTDDEKRRRNKVLLEDQDTRAQRINDRQVGQVVDVLVEGVSRRNAARWTGRTRSNKIVVFEPVAGLKENEEVRVHISRAMPQTLYGAIEKSS